MPSAIKLEAVRNAVENLLDRKTHPAFVGYLCICAEARTEGRLTKLKPDFKKFFESYLQVPGGPEGKPYYRPFWHQARSRTKAWYQANVAGSFSPASAVRIQPLVQCVSVDVAEGSFTLRQNHEALALEHLALDVPIAILDAAVYLLRDYVMPGNVRATAKHLVQEFQLRFVPASDFGTIRLFEIPSDLDSVMDLFEDVNQPVGAP